MRKFLSSFVTCCFAVLVTSNAYASVINPVAGQWYGFDVDELVAQDTGLGWIDAVVDPGNGYVGDGSSLSFVFSLAQAAWLTVVDAGLSGDEFAITVNDVNYVTSQVAVESVNYVGTDFDVALADPVFSRISLLLLPGNYTLNGSLWQSAVYDQISLNTTLGAIRITAVDEPHPLVLLSISLMGLLLMRRYSAPKNTEVLV